MRRCIALVLAALSCAAGCSQQSSTLVPAGGVLPPARGATLTLRIKIPGASKAARRRAPAYVSAATKGMVLTFAGASTFRNVVALTPSSPGCTGAPLECTIRVNVKPGRYSVSVATYDRAPLSGSIPAGAHLLSIASGVPAFVSRGAANTFRIALDGVPSRIVVSGFPDATAGTGFLSKPFTVRVEDAGNYVIVGTYEMPITLVDSDTSGATLIATTGSDDPPRSALLSSADGATISYSGASIAPAKITAESGSVKGYGVFAVHLPVFVADSGNAALKEIPPGCVNSSCVQTICSCFDGPSGIALDSSGDVFVADAKSTYSSSYEEEVRKIPPGCASTSCMTVIGGGFGAIPGGLAVDDSGDVFVTDPINSAVKEIPHGCLSSSCVVTIGGGFSVPGGVAVDSAGNLFVADTGNDAVKKMAPSCLTSACVTTIAGGFNNPKGVAVDLSDNVFVADSQNNAVKKIPAGCQSSACVVTLGGGFNGPASVAVDAFGYVFVSDRNNSQVKEIPSGCTDAGCVAILGGGFSTPIGVGIL